MNAVERNPWKAVAFSADSEHVVAAAFDKTNKDHLMYIWNRHYGTMEKILEGKGLFPFEYVVSKLALILRKPMRSSTAVDKQYNHLPQGTASCHHSHAVLLATLLQSWHSWL